jgi:hypothetical protein
MANEKPKPKTDKATFIRKNAPKGAAWIATQLGITKNNVYVTASNLGIKLGKGKKTPTTKPAKSTAAATKKTPTEKTDHRQKLEFLYEQKFKIKKDLEWIEREITSTIKLIK